MAPLVVLTKLLVHIASVYYVDGNHKQDVKRDDPDVYALLNKALSDLGAVQLKNEIASYTAKSGAFVNLCGITRYYTGEMKSRFS